MAGRKRGGATASAITLLAELIVKKQQEQRKMQARASDMYQKFAYEATLAQIRKGTLRFDPNTGTIVPSTPPLAQPKGGFLPGSETSKMLADAQPGKPMSTTRPRKFDEFTGEPVGEVNNVPFGTRGINSMNSIIQSGATESPAAGYATQDRRHLFTGNEIPEGPYAPGPGGTAVGGEGDYAPDGGMLPRSSVLGILNDPVVRTGVDEETGKRVGMTKTGQIVPLE